MVEPTPVERRTWFDPVLAGRSVQADGGAEVVGANHGARELYEGTLTGRRLEYGDPPWRFLEIAALTLAPDGFDAEAVWCEESYVYDLREGRAG